MPLAHFRHVCYAVIAFSLNAFKKHLIGLSNNLLHVHVFNISTSLNFVSWPHAAETNNACIRALRPEIFH